MKRTRIISLFLALAAALSVVGCGQSGSPEADPGTQTAETTPAETVPEYVYPDKDYGGYRFKVLNSVNYWGAHLEMDFDSLSGDLLSDEIYNRNRRVEERFNIDFEFTQIDTNDKAFDAMVSTAQNSILAGDEEWDVMFLSGYKTTPIISAGCLMDLSKVDGLNLDKPWYDHNVLDKVSLDGKIFFAIGAAQLMSYDMTEVIFFNRNMMDDHKLEYPYDLVRDGKWTIDRMKELAASVASLNGADSWKWDQNNATVYGISAHPTTTPNKMYLAMGADFTTVENGTYSFMKDSSAALNALEKVSMLLDTSAGVTLKASYNDMSAPEGGYAYVFSVDRALFAMLALKSTSYLRDMKSDFGLLPYPKYDENQENYYCQVGISSLGLTIPVTSSDPERAAVIMDALNYDSYANVLSKYYDIMLSQKLLRDSESIEMLDIINQSRTTDLALLYSMMDDFVNTMNSKAFSGDTDYASSIASSRPAIENKFKTLLEQVH